MERSNSAVSADDDTRRSVPRSSWKKRRVLVTGATGFIGRSLTRMLVEAGADVWAGLFAEEPAATADRLPPEASRLTIDVRDAKSVSQAVAEADPEAVFHLAAIGVTDASSGVREVLEVNTGGTVNVLEALREQDIRRVVLVGTSYEYGARQAREGLDPFSFYGASKAGAWAFARVYWRTLGMPIVVARPGQVYGPGQPRHTLIPAAVQAALAGADFPMTHGEQRRDFVFVDDVAEGLLAQATAPDIEGRSLDLGTGTTSTIHEVVQAIWAITGAQGRILAGDLPARPGEPMDVAVDAETTTKHTGWRASVSLEDGLRRVVQAVREESSSGVTEA